MVLIHEKLHNSIAFLSLVQGVSAKLFVYRLQENVFLQCLITKCGSVILECVLVLWPEPFHMITQLFHESGLLWLFYGIQSGVTGRTSGNVLLSPQVNGIPGILAHG